jgi:hypothetical protein
LNFPADKPRKATLIQVAPLKFVVVEDFKPGIKEIGDITIPRGFTSDLYSIPRILWSILPPHHCPVEAALIHDYSYRLQQFSTVDMKKIADKFFYISMVAYGVNKNKARLFTNAVSLFGSPKNSPKIPLMPLKQINNLKNGVI